jgi:hypothetical protein
LVGADPDGSVERSLEALFLRLGDVQRTVEFRASSRALGEGLLQVLGGSVKLAFLEAEPAPLCFCLGQGFFEGVAVSDDSRQLTLKRIAVVSWSCHCGLK